MTKTMNSYQWHQAISIYPDRGGKSYRLKRLRYGLRSALHRGLIGEFQQQVNQDPALVAELSSRANFCYPLVHRFLDKRFNAKQRLNAMLDNFRFLPQIFARNHLPSPWGQNVSLGEIVPDFEMTLGLNHHQPMEGFWALELRYKPQDKLVYVLTFGKIDQALLIAVIQGPNFEGSKETVKLLTKKCHGLRPAYLMVETMKILCGAFGYTQLWGIPQQYQNKSRWVQSKRYVVDYDQIFAESSGERGQYWQLPTQFERKNLDEIASQKRSMYRKRYAMLEVLETRARQLFSVK